MTSQPPSCGYRFSPAIRGSNPHDPKGHRILSSARVPPRIAAFLSTDGAKIPGVNHQDAVRALEQAGFRVVRQSKHVVMTDGARILTIPRHNPVNA